MSAPAKPFRLGIAGRPNVGKSSLFNALLGFRRAIVLDLPGTTRDEIAEKAKWAPLCLVDSQGIFGEEDQEALESVIGNCDAFLFVVDAITGPTPFDRWIAGFLKRSDKPVLVCVNKTDGRAAHAETDFAELGFEAIVGISVAHRWNLDAVKDWARARVPAPAEEAPREASAELSPLEPEDGEAAAPVKPDPEPLLVAIVGRPNTGKSTLMNRLCGGRISRVSPEPLTTRDPVSHEISTPRGIVRLIDTAGMRRPRSEKEQLETFAIQATTRAIRGADVVFLCIASHEPITDQDMRILNLVEREGKPLVILLNFWDRLDAKARRVFLEESDFGRVIKPFRILQVSGRTGFQVERILPLAWKLATTAQRRVRTSKLNRFVEKLVQYNPPPARGRTNFNILYASQVKVEPPTFVFFMNRKANLPVSYQKYVENSLRDKLGFRGQTIRVFFRSSER